MAVCGHAIWNLGGSIVIGLLSIGLHRVYLVPEWEALIVAGILGGLPFTVPPILTAFIFAKLGREQEDRVVRTYLPIEVGIGTLSPVEAANVFDEDKRAARLKSVRQMAGRQGLKRQQRFNQLATRLAFFHYHAQRGERPYGPEIRRAEQLRWQLAATRWAMRAFPPAPAAGRSSTP
jgi:hypothetical protein